MSYASLYAQSKQRNNKNILLQMKRSYNNLLREYLLKDDGGQAIAQDIAFRNINRGLIKLASKIIDAEGHTVNNNLDIINYFKNGELYKGFNL